MKQQTLAMAADQGRGFERYRRRAKREDFLDSIEAIVPYAASAQASHDLPDRWGR